MSDIDLEALSAAERLGLIALLWDSLADADIPETAAQRAELERRLARFDEERSAYRAWEDVRAALLPVRR